jgi:simple sugar transport system ATP-binding protein
MDRHDALLLEQSVVDNIALKGAGRRRGWFRRGTAELAAEQLVVATGITRGLDVATTAEIHRRLREASRTGMAVVYHTPDLDELLEVSHRVVVVFEGRVRAVARDRRAVGSAMLGAA